MGEVYRAHDPRLGRDIALKVIRRALVVDGAGERRDSQAIDRLLREATLASALNHPNIVTIHETGVVGDDRYIAMELVEGSTLRKIAGESVPVERALGIARQVAEALAVAHAAQIVHRDIKPENVMVRPDGYTKLLDFGLARLHETAVTAASTGPGSDPGVIVGTVGYMAPEQARGESAAPEADVFAFGVMLYELVTGKHPFMASSQLGTLHALMWETPEPPSLVNPDVPRSLDQLVLEMLQKDQRLRPGAGEVLYRLALAHDSSAATALSSMTVSQRAARTSRAVVGRDLEMDALQHEFERVQRGTGRVVVLSAEAGVGKTTLIDAFVRLARGQWRSGAGRARALLGAAGRKRSVPPGARGPRKPPAPRAAWQPVAPDPRARAELVRADHAAVGERLVGRTAGRRHGARFPGAAEAGDLGAARRGRADAAGRPLLRRRALGGPVDDRPARLPRAPHGAHAPAAHRHVPSVRAGAGAASVPCRSSWTWSRAAWRGRLSPGPLDEAAIDRYLSLQFTDHQLPRGFAAVIHQRTEGHPLFVVDLLRDLRRRQILRQQDGAWIVTEDLASLERAMPESMRSLVQRKIEALDDEDRRLLGAASVQGIDFDTAMLAAVLEWSEESIEDRLERLEREHALVRFVDEWEAPDQQLTLRYRFAHHIYHNAFDESLRATRRAALSRAVAEQLIARMAAQPCDCAGDIALAARIGARPDPRGGILEPGGAGLRAAVRARRDGAARAARAGAPRRARPSLHSGRRPSSRCR